MAEIEYLMEVGACALDVGDELAFFQRGHQSPWELRAFVRAECPMPEDEGWPRHEWWREVPYSIQNPDEPPCQGEESTLYVPCAKGAAGAWPVTVLWL